VSGADSRGIAVMGSDLTRAERALELVDAPKGAVTESGNATRRGQTKK